MLRFCLTHECGVPFESIDGETFCSKCRGSDKTLCPKFETELPNHMSGCPDEGKRL